MIFIKNTRFYKVVPSVKIDHIQYTLFALIKNQWMPYWIGNRTGGL